MNNVCPSCSAVYNITPKNIGRRILCIKCSVGLVVTQRGLEVVPTKPPPPPPPPVVQQAAWHPGMAPPGHWQPAPPPAPTRPREDFDDFDDDPEPARKPRWLQSFGSGCGLVKWGMWVNFAGFAYLILLLEIGLASLQSRATPNIPLGMFTPMYLFELAGTGMMLAGWWRMTAAPSNSGAVGLMTGAGILAGLRCLLLFVGTVYLVMAVAGRGLDGIRYLFHSGTAFSIAEICLLVATFTAIPGMAIIGGEVPNRALRQRAGWITLIHQVLAIVLLALLAFAIYMVWMNDFVGGLGGGADIGGRDEEVRPPRRGEFDRPVRERPGDPIPMAMFFLLAILAIRGAYTFLHASLYAAGQNAAGRGSDVR